MIRFTLCRDTQVGVVMEKRKEQYAQITEMCYTVEGVAAVKILLCVHGFKELCILHPQCKHSRVHIHT
jgi:glycerol-3-phosphate dehydrogenase